jgi:signal transduction histidine kinase/DNA-binding response OmpR family regulator
MRVTCSCIVFIIWLGLAPKCLGQATSAQIDSLLLEVANATSDTAKVMRLADISFGYRDILPVQGLHYGAQALKLAKEIGYKKGIARAYNVQAVNYERQANYYESVELGLKALKINEEIGYELGIENNLGNIGNAYDALMNYDRALEYHKKALELAEKIKDTAGIARHHNNMAGVYIEKKDLARADAHYNKALEYKQALGDKVGMVRIIGNIASLYVSQNDYKKALQYFFIARDLTATLNEAHLHTIALLNIGGTYIMAAEDTAKEIASRDFKEYSRSQLLDSAIVYLSAGIPTMNQLGSKDLFMQAYSLLSRAYELKGNQQMALDAYKKYKLYADTVFNFEKQEQLARLETQREVELKDKRIEIDQLIIAKRKREKWIYIGSIGLLVLLTGGIIGRLRHVNKTNRLLEESNEHIAREKENAEEMRSRAERSEQFKQDFLANMSHEIRTPMNAVMGMTELLLIKDPRQDQLLYMDAIRKSSNTLLHIVNDVLDLSKIEAGKITMEEIDFSLRDCIEQVHQLLKLKAEEKSLLFHAIVDDVIPDILIGDPTRLKQVLINLAGNAIKFTAQGSVMVEVTLVSETAAQTSLKLSVKDTGIGIPTDKMEEIFESFSQAHNSDTRKFGGTGLGLTISKQLIVLQGGELIVESSEGAGSCFYFILDFKKGSAPGIEKQSAMALQLPPDMRILVADDNEYNRIVCIETLKSRAEVHIDSALNGLEVLEQLKANDYDVILMDIQMPDMDGYEATRRIRADLPQPKCQTPIIALTASVLKEDLRLCTESGMNAYVTKPFRPDQLVAAILHVTGNKQSERNQPLSARINSMALVTDLSYLHKFCEGDEKQIVQYRKSFCETTTNFIHRMDDSLETQNYKLLHKQVHAIKPRLQMMGMDRGVLLAIGIEKKCMDQVEWKHLEAPVRELCFQLRKAMEELDPERS